MADQRLVPAPRPRGVSDHLGLRVGRGGFAAALCAALALAGVRCFSDLVVTPSQPSLVFAVTPESTDVAIGDTVAPFAGTLTANGQPVSFRLRLDVTQGSSFLRADSVARVAALARGVARLEARPLLSAFTSDTLRRTVTVRAIVPRLAVAATPSVDTLTSVGDTIHLRAAALTRGGDTIPGVPIVWRQLSGSSSVQLLDSTVGRARATSNGLAEFLAAVDTATARRQVRVVQVPVSVSAPDSARLTSLGQTVLLAAAVRDARGNDVAGAVAVWTSLQPGIAAVDGVTGLVTAVANGTARIEAKFGAVADTTQVTVSQVPRKLAFAVSPQATTAGQALAPAIAVAVQDSLGSVVTGFTGDVTVVLGTNPGTGVLAGTTTVAAVAGVATFGTLSISVAGTGYGLTATSGMLTGATSGAFEIAPAAASQLSFTVQPTGSWTGVAISPAVQVTALDPFGNVATNFTGNVTVAIGTNPGSGSLSGTTTVAAVAGVATFGTLNIDKAGTGYTLTAGATGLSAATSTTFEVAARVAVVVVTPSGASLSGVGATQAFTAQARDSLGNVLAGRTITWASLNPDVATVNASSGVVTAVASGQVTIAATVEGVSGYGLVTVVVPAVAAVNLWASMPSGTSQYLFGVWGASSTNAFAVGDGGTILGNSGGGWVPQSSGDSRWVLGVWGVSGSSVFAVGQAGLALHFDGASWSAMTSGVDTELRRLWGSSPVDVYAVGAGGRILHYDGTSWSSASSGTTQNLFGVWGTSASDVYAVGDGGTILHFDGTNWSGMASPTTQALEGVWGTSGTSIYAGGAAGTLLHFDGSSWSAIPTGTSEVLADIGGTSGTDINIAASGGTIVRFDGSTLTYSATGSGEWLRGMWTSSVGDAFAVGTSGAIYRGVRGATVTVAPAGATISTIGATQQLTATARTAAGDVVSDVTFTWSSGDPNVATVTSSGLVSPVSNGTATITATATGGAAGTATVTVSLTDPQAAARLSAGGLHTCALGADGAAYCWGDNPYGQLGNGDPSKRGASPVVALGGLVFQSINAGDSHTCGIATGGAVYCWGHNSYGQLGDGTSGDHGDPRAILGGLTFQKLSAGPSHTCGLTTGGAAYCWGYNGSGQLGDGTSSDRSSPVAVSGGLVFQSISAGIQHTCGLTTSGTAYCWGYNGNGQLGDGTTGNHSSPVAVAGGHAFYALSVGDLHTCALTAGGAAYCWGANDAGQLGDGSTAERWSPTAVSGGRVFQAASAGPSHTCALTTGGAAYCWGRNPKGQLGDGTTSDRTSPVAVTGGVTLQTLSAGSSHTCGLTTGGAASCWGDNSYDQLGLGAPIDRTSPVAVSGGIVFQEIKAGAGHSCGITTGGTAYCWGSNPYGNLGDGTTSERTSPVAVLGGPALPAGIWVGGNAHTCGLTTGGAAYCWGSDFFGQLGDGRTAPSRASPVAVSGGLLFQALGSGFQHTCGLTPGGAAYCWGSNGWGQLGDGTGTDRSTPVAVLGGLVFQSISAGSASVHTCGLTAGGAAYCWGSNDYKQLGDGSGTNQWTPVPVSGGLVFQSISAGNRHTCGVTTGGAAHCWGLSDHGQLGDGTNESRTSPVAVSGGLVFQAISAGGFHTCGITMGGAAYCWGLNGGQLGDGTRDTPIDHWNPVAVVGGLTFKAISAGFFHTCGLTTSGAAYCWGSNGSGVLGDGTAFRTSPVAVTGGVVFGAPAAAPTVAPVPGPRSR